MTGWTAAIAAKKQKWYHDDDDEGLRRYCCLAHQAFPARGIEERAKVRLHLEVIMGITDLNVGFDSQDSGIERKREKEETEGMKYKARLGKFDDLT
jgi:hypothetical protein